MLFRVFASATKHIKIASWLANAWRPSRLGCRSDGWRLSSMLAICRRRRSSNLLAGSLAHCRLESRSACELAAVADQQVNQLRGWAIALSCFFRGLVRGLAVFAILYSKIAHFFSGVWSCPPAWPAPGWQLPGCLAGQWTGPPARWLPTGQP